MTFSGALAGAGSWAGAGVLAASKTMRPAIAQVMPLFAPLFTLARLAAGRSPSATPAGPVARKPKISLIFMPLPKQAEALNPTAKPEDPVRPRRARAGHQAASLAHLVTPLLGLARVRPCGVKNPQ